MARMEIEVDEKGEMSQKKWHIDKTINLAHVLTTAGLITMLFAWGGTVEKNIAVLQAQNANQKQIDATQDEQWRATVQLLREEIREVGRKLDRLNENVSHGRRQQP